MCGSVARVLQFNMWTESLFLSDLQSVQLLDYRTLQIDHWHHEAQRQH